MTPRSIRRAAERKAVKLARKAGQPLASLPTDLLSGETEGFDSQSFQSQSFENGLLENQPPQKSAQEKIPIPILPADAVNAYLTAITSALTGHATLLPTSDAGHYDQLIREFHGELQPVGPQESILVQTMAVSAWRMSRTVGLEMTIFAKGRIEFAEQFAAHNADLRLSLIDVHTFLTYEKQIRGLQSQEARLSRRADQARAELQRLQTERTERAQAERRRQQQQRQQELEAAAQLYETAQENCQIFDPQENGFEFSNDEIEEYLAKRQAARDRFSAMLSLPMRGVSTQGVSVSSAAA